MQRERLRQKDSEFCKHMEDVKKKYKERYLEMEAKVRDAISTKLTKIRSLKEELAAKDSQNKKLAELLEKHFAK